MTFRTIMVQLDVDAAAEPRLRFASELARQFEADLIAVAAAQARFVVPVGDDGIVAADAMRWQIEEIEARLIALEREFQIMTADNPRASWRGYVGDPTRILASNARAADLIVVGSPGPAVIGDHNRTVDQGALILSAGRPILLASADLAPVRYESAVVAWKDTREARRAVVDAMPFLTKAQHVVVVTVENDEGKPARESAADVVLYLMKHGVKARSEVMDVGDSLAADALAQVASEIGANLIVSGGYGHSRLREWALGGVTRSLLRETGVHRVMSN